MRLGILGGTFDPIHNGHLLLAESCREQCRLDRVLLVPAATAPHKQQRQTASAQQRVEMLQLAIGGHEALAVSTTEIERGGISYTADTLRAIGEQHPQAELFFLMGSDSLADFPNWRQPEGICELATVVVVHRAGEDAPDYHVLDGIVSADRLKETASHQVEMPRIGLSSSDIRDRIATGRSIRYRTPRAVEKYIETQGLYGARGEG